MSGLAFIPPFCAWVNVSRVRRHGGNPHQPLLAAGAAASPEDLACRKLEEGVDVPRPPNQPMLPRMSDAAWSAWHIWKIFFRCFTTVLGIAIVAPPFVSQDPFKIIPFAILGLSVIGAGYFTTLDECVDI